MKVTYLSTQGKLTRIIFMRLPFHMKLYENHANIMRKTNTCISCEENLQFSCENHAIIMRFSYL